MNILTRNFASTRPVQIATWTYKRYNLIVIFASTRPVQIATRPRLCVWHDLFRFASTRSVQIATRKAVSMLCFLRFASTRSVQIATGLCADCHQKRALCLHTLRADCNCRNAQNCNIHFSERVLSR